MGIKENIRDNLTYYIKKKGYTQNSLAKELGISRSNVSNWLIGKSNIVIDDAFKVCDILGITINDLYQNPLERDNGGVSEEDRFMIKEYMDLSERDKKLIRSLVDNMYKSIE